MGWNDKWRQSRLDGLAGLPAPHWTMTPGRNPAGSEPRLFGCNLGLGAKREFHILVFPFGRVGGPVGGQAAFASGLPFPFQRVAR